MNLQIAITSLLFLLLSLAIAVDLPFIIASFMVFAFKSYQAKKFCFWKNKCTAFEHGKQNLWRHICFSAQAVWNAVYV